MSTIIQCPNCSKKLKLSKVPEGKKVRCPGCQEAFQPSAAVPAPQKKSASSPKAAATRKPKPKPKPKRPAPVEDYVDFDDDSMYEEEPFEDDYDQPAPKPSGRRKSAGKKSRGKKGAKNKKAAASSSSKAPLFIGIGVLVAGLIGGGVYFAFFTGDDADDPAIADTGTGTGTDAADGGSGSGAGTDPAAGMSSTGGSNPGGSGSGGSGGSDGHGAGSSGSGAGSNASGDGHGAEGGSSTAMNAGNSGSGSGTPAGSGAFTSSVAAGNASGTGTSGSGSASTPLSAPAVSASIDTKWLPQNSELVARIEVKKLLDGPLSGVLGMAAAQIAQFRERTGFGPTDIDNVTIGIADLSSLAAQQQRPDGNNAPAVVVVRANVSIDLPKLQSSIPQAETASSGGISYIRVPEDPPGAIWLPDSNTAVVGAENWVLAAAAATNAPGPVVDGTLVDSKSAIQVAFRPANPDAVFRPQPIPPPPGQDPVNQALFEFLQVVQPNISSAGICLDITTDISLTAAVGSNSPQSAAQNLAALNTLITKAKQLAAQQPPQNQGMSFMPMPSPEDLLNQLVTINNGSTTSASITQKNAGSQLALAIPLAVPMIMSSFQQGMQTGQQLGQRNNFKQVALAMHNFHDAWGRFPNVEAKNAEGKKLLSWRVHILEFLGPNEQALYEQFNLEEPWDSPTNIALLPQMPAVFQSPESTAPGKTLVQVAVGPGTMFEGAEGRSMADCSDGTSNTILIVEASPDHAVNWTEPADLAFDPNSPGTGLGAQPGVFKAAFADGRVLTLDATLDSEVLKALFSRNAGDFVPQDAMQDMLSNGGGFGPGGPPGGGFGPGGFGN